MDLCCRDDLKSNIPAFFKTQKVYPGCLGRELGSVMCHTLLWGHSDNSSPNPSWINQGEVPANPAWQSPQLLLLCAQICVSLWDLSFPASSTAKKSKFPPLLRHYGHRNLRTPKAHWGFSQRTFAALAALIMSWSLIDNLWFVWAGGSWPAVSYKRKISSLHKLVTALFIAQPRPQNVFVPLFWCCKFRVRSSSCSLWVLLLSAAGTAGQFLGIFPNYTQREDSGRFSVGWEIEKKNGILKRNWIFFPVERRNCLCLVCIFYKIGLSLPSIVLNRYFVFHQQTLHTWLWLLHFPVRVINYPTFKPCQTLHLQRTLTGFRLDFNRKIW